MTGSSAGLHHAPQHDQLNRLFRKSQEDRSVDGSPEDLQASPPVDPLQRAVARKETENGEAVQSP